MRAHLVSLEPPFMGRASLALSPLLALIILALLPTSTGGLLGRWGTVRPNSGCGGLVRPCIALHHLGAGQSPLSWLSMIRCSHLTEPAACAPAPLPPRSQHLGFVHLGKFNTLTSLYGSCSLCHFPHPQEPPAGSLIVSYSGYICTCTFNA